MIVSLFLWLIPLVIAVGFFGLDNVAVELYLFFTQAAFVTFGGAYAALAETTPGPLIIVLQFIGFLTGWQNAGGYDQTLFAVSCGVLITVATFIPSFLFVFLGSQNVERLQG